MPGMTESPIEQVARRPLGHADFVQVTRFGDPLTEQELDEIERLAQPLKDYCSTLGFITLVQIGPDTNIRESVMRND